MADRGRRRPRKPVPQRRRHSVPRQRGYDDDPAHDPAMRQEISRVIASAQRGLQGLRMLYIADAGIVGLVFLVALTTDHGWFQVAVGGLLAAAVLGAIYVVRFPLPCSIALAVVHSVPAALVAAFGLWSITGYLIVALAALCWMGVHMAKNMQQLIRRYPDVWAAKRARGEGRGADEMGIKWRDQSRRQKAEQRKRMLLFVGLLITVAIAALVLFGGQDDANQGDPDSYVAPAPREPLQPRLDRFQASWNGQKLVEIRKYFAKDVEDRKSGLLGKLFRRRKWVEKRPPITFQKRDSVVAHQVAIFWTIEGEEKLLQTDWQWENDGWWLLDLKLRIQR